MKTGSARGLVFNIQKFSLHDGAGIRTLVFLKGCPLSCRWCANPEGISPSVELAFDPAKCIGTNECRRCLEACPSGAVRPSAHNSRVEIDRTRCDACGLCADACPSRALERVGRWMTVEEVLREVEEDSGFYARSGGGLTLSGGEPLLQAAFSVEVLRAARDRGIHTALETSGSCPWEDLEAACSLADEIFFDVKARDSTRHREGTGVPNERILENLRRLCARLPDRPIQVRTPVIPGYNDTPAEIRAIAELLQSLPRPVTYELLPFHRFGEPKYARLGKPCPLGGLAPPSPGLMASLKRYATGRSKETQFGAGIEQNTRPS